jgi:hypothetical protein
MSAANDWWALAVIAGAAAEGKDLAPGTGKLESDHRGRKIGSGAASRFRL